MIWISWGLKPSILHMEWSDLPRWHPHEKKYVFFCWMLLCNSFLAVACNKRNSIPLDWILSFGLAEVAFWNLAQFHASPGTIHHHAHRLRLGICFNVFFFCILLSSGSLLTHLLTDLLTSWLTALLTCWLPDLLPYWLADFLTYWLPDFLTYWLTDWLTYWLPDSLTHWLTDSLTYWTVSHWLTDLLTDWLTYWLTDLLTLLYLITHGTVPT